MLWRFAVVLTCVIAVAAFGHHLFGEGANSRILIAGGIVGAVQCIGWRRHDEDEGADSSPEPRPFRFDVLLLSAIALAGLGYAVFGPPGAILVPLLGAVCESLRYMCAPVRAH